MNQPNPQTLADFGILTLADYLNQGEVWGSKDGPFLIKDMDAVYRRRAIHWLTRNCSKTFDYLSLETFVDGDETPSVEWIIKSIDSRPSRWIRETPLFRALATGLPPELIP
jgi:hypothetical protein